MYLYNAAAPHHRANSALRARLQPVAEGVKTSAALKVIEKIFC
jgi:hypothetical protein